MVFYLACIALSTHSFLRRWHEPLSSPQFRQPVWWPHSRNAYLGLCAGDAVAPLWWLTAMGVGASGRIGDLLTVLFALATCLLASLLLLGQPDFLMPPALRGIFRGAVRVPGTAWAAREATDTALFTTTPLP